ncbi:hypothetical protein [Methylopila sp. 73B]|uniref:hypothetical protein n=1 Tax=Methylopila sp. 73B TaxID=1120792 RepID=UPI0012DC9C82|nr:hypothetical protein [Methylopila sp. 73B]
MTAILPADAARTHGRGRGTERALRHFRRAKTPDLALPLLALTLAMLESAFVAVAGGLARLVGGG